MQRVFASKWLVWSWCLAGALICPALALAAAEVGWEVFNDWRTAVWTVLISVSAAALGFMLAILAGWIFLAPIFHARAKANGAPFKEGDIVQVITGPHRGTVARVYSQW